MSSESVPPLPKYPTAEAAATSRRTRWLGGALIATAASAGCVVTANPDFTQPKQTPPFLTNLKPAPYQVQSLHSIGAPGMYRSQTLTFEIVSEDLQSQPLQALLFRDFAGFSQPYDRELLGMDLKIPSGHLNDPPRPDSFEFTFNAVLPGCHSVTLAVSHAFRQDLGSQKILPVVETDVATATWWYDLDDDPTRGDQLTTCVIRNVTAEDAGADATESGAAESGAP